MSEAAVLKLRPGIDIAAQANLLTGDLNIASDTHTTVVRAQVSNPSAAGALLSKLSAPGSASNGRKARGLRGHLCWHRLGDVANRVPDLFQITLKHAPSPIEQQLVGVIGDLTGGIRHPQRPDRDRAARPQVVVPGAIRNESTCRLPRSETTL